MPVAEPAETRRAVTAYHALLEDDRVAQASIEALRQGQEDRRLVFGDHPLCISLRPQLIDRRDYDRAVAAAKGTYSALRALERALLRDADLRAELDLDADEERLAMADPGVRSSSSSARLDSFFADEVRYVEYNAESPAGIAYSDNLAAVFDDLPVMKRFRKRFRLRSLPVRRRQLAAMLRAFRQWGREKEPVVAIVDWKGLPTVAEFEMFRDAFEEQGITALICDPTELEYRRGRLYADGTHVTMVYRRVLTTELLAKGEEARAMADAYLDGAVCVVNSFRAKLLHKKMSLALLSDDRYAPLYTTAQRSAIARHIPWTRRVQEGSTTYGADRIDDLGAYVVENRERLVLKPNDEYGGKGVVLGWTVEPSEWEQALTVALTQSYVVQEAVPVPREPFAVALDHVEHLDLAMDMDPYLFDGRPSGCLTRLSSSALLNVTAGAGSVVPTFVVEGAR